MGGRGSASGGNGTARTRDIKKEFIQHGLNSKIAGIRAKAEAGTGNYSFKNAKPVDFGTASKMTNSVIHERGDNTLVEGYLSDGSHVCYANKTSSSEIKALKEKRESKNKDTTLRRADMTGKTTTTYDTWLKKQRKKFDNYWKR